MSSKTQYREKILYFPLKKKISLLCYLGICDNVLLPNLHSIICPMVDYGRLKKKRKFQTLSVKSCRDRLREVVAYKGF